MNLWAKLRKWTHAPIERREQQILDALRTHGEMSSYQLQQTSGVSINWFYVITPPMEKDGRIVSRWGPATAIRGWRRQRLYRINGTPVLVIGREPHAAQF